MVVHITMRALDISILSVLLMATMSCGPANANDAEFWDPASGEPVVVGDDGGVIDDDGGTEPDTGSGSDAGPKADAGPAPSTCLHVDFTTKTYFGRYAPSHVLAVWISNASGGFVKTLDEHGKGRASNLVTWRSASGGSTVDAVTGATLKSHGVVSANWNCTNAAGARVPAGAYQLHVEFAESNVRSTSAAGPQLVVNFETGKAATLTPPDTANYLGTKVVITP